MHASDHASSACFRMHQHCMIQTKYQALHDSDQISSTAWFRQNAKHCTVPNRASSAAWFRQHVKHVMLHTLHKALHNSDKVSSTEWLDTRHQSLHDFDNVWSTSYRSCRLCRAVEYTFYHGTQINHLMLCISCKECCAHQARAQIRHTVHAWVQKHLNAGLAPCDFP